jgi:hypothetical protein
MIKSKAKETENAVENPDGYVIRKLTKELHIDSENETLCFLLDIAMRYIIECGAGRIPIISGYYGEPKTGGEESKKSQMIKVATVLKKALKEEVVVSKEWYKQNPLKGKTY